MNALVISRQAQPREPIAPVIRFDTDWPDPPPPGPGQALVRTLAAALNHLDLWVARGVPGLNLTYPRISGSDACGIVEAVGPDVPGDWLGKRVVLNAAIDVSPTPTSAEPPRSTLAPTYQLIGEHHHGVFASNFLAPTTNLQFVPETFEPIEAAAYGLTFLTAYSMMITKAGLRPGQSVLITGIGGGVALASLAN